jgi:hypothetical protein
MYSGLLGHGELAPSVGIIIGMEFINGCLAIGRSIHSSSDEECSDGGEPIAISSAGFLATRRFLVGGLRTEEVDDSEGRFLLAVAFLVEE